VSETGNDNTAVKTWFDKTGKEIRNENKGFSETMIKNGNRLTIADPSAGTITNTWYGTGQQKTSTNANGKLTTWYYQADGLPDYVVTDSLTDYTYNTKSQVSSISSPDGVSRSYTYNTKGQVTAVTESVDGVSNTVAFEYDSFGRLYKKTFNSTDYEQYDYQNGYLYKIRYRINCVAGNNHRRIFARKGGQYWRNCGNPGVQHNHQYAFANKRHRRSAVRL
jgi:YD repeat-containing protein